MKKIVLALLLVSGCNQPAKQPPAPTPEAKPISEDCILVASIADQSDKYPLQLCMYTHTEVRGIFAATACVAVLIEGQTGTRHAFYGSKGHWGIEGTCDAKKITDKFLDNTTMTTMNPISDLRAKRKQGKKIQILHDEFKLGDTLLQVTKP